MIYVAAEKTKIPLLTLEEPDRSCANSAKWLPVAKCGCTLVGAHTTTSLKALVRSSAAQEPGITGSQKSIDMRECKVNWKADLLLLPLQKRVESTRRGHENTVFARCSRQVSVRQPCRSCML
jgi:hypothetical protein